MATQRNYHEIPSQGGLATRYFSGGNIQRLPTPLIPESSQLAGFRIVHSRLLRPATRTTTAAREMTLQIEGENAELIAENLQPGITFALEAKNNRETVDAILSALKPSPEVMEDGRIDVPAHSAYMKNTTMQQLPPREILAGLVDVARPTEQLVNLLAERAEQSGSPFPLGWRAQELCACYSVAELLHYRPHVLTLEEVMANQPELKARPYTISDFNPQKRQINILVSDVNAAVSTDDPLNLRDAGAKREPVKHGGTATSMLMDIATAGENGHPDANYVLNGYVLTHVPRLLFPGVTQETKAISAHYETAPEAREEMDKIAQYGDDSTLYFLATGSGMAPYMAFLRHMSRMQQADPDHQKTFKGKVVLINGMRADEDELYADECRQYVRDGLLSSYHAVHSATKSETVVTVQNGAVQEAIYDYPAKPYVQAALETHYGHGLEQAVSDRKAIVYVCGALGALEGVVQKWPQCFADKPEALQRTASLPDRYFNNYWQRKTIATHHLEPLPSARRRPETCAWTQRILRISPTSQQQAAHGRG